MSNFVSDERQRHQRSTTSLKSAIATLVRYLFPIMSVTLVVLVKLIRYELPDGPTNGDVSTNTEMTANASSVVKSCTVETGLPWRDSKFGQGFCEFTVPLQVPSILLLFSIAAVFFAILAQPHVFKPTRTSLPRLFGYIAIYLFSTVQIINLVHTSDLWTIDYTEFLLSFAATFVSLGLTAKAIIGFQLASLASKSPWTAEEWITEDPTSSSLLPSQAETLTALREAVRSDPKIGAGHLVQLVGNWGSGKTTILRRFAAGAEELGRNEPVSANDAPLTDQESVAVAMIHVWRHEDDRDLHRAIVEAIIGSHLRLDADRAFSISWLRIPSTLLIARHFREVTLSLSFSIRGTTMTTSSDVPDLFAQRSLDYFLTYRRQTLVVLDELDRATPQVAQAVLTLVRRSLDVAGCTTLLAYAEAIVRFKTMNPLSTLLPDIRSSVEALLSIQIGPPGESDFKDQSLLRTSDDGSGTWFDQGDWLRRRWLMTQDRKTDSGKFVGVDDFYKVVEQKYLSSNIVTVRPLFLFRNGIQSARFAICNEIPSILQSDDLAWRLTSLERKQPTACILDKSQLPQVLAARIAGEMSRVLAVLATYNGSEGTTSLVEELRNPYVPQRGSQHNPYDWVSSFDFFIERMSEFDKFDIPSIAWLLDSHVPLRRLVSAWIAVLDKSQAYGLTEDRCLMDWLPSVLVEHALRIACDDLERHASPNLGIEDTARLTPSSSRTKSKSRRKALARNE